MFYSVQNQIYPVSIWLHWSR